MHPTRKRGDLSIMYASILRAQTQCKREAAAATATLLPGFSHCDDEANSVARCSQIPGPPRTCRPELPKPTVAVVHRQALKAPPLSGPVPSRLRYGQSRLFLLRCLGTQENKDEGELLVSREACLVGARLARITNHLLLDTSRDDTADKVVSTAAALHLHLARK